MTERLTAEEMAEVYSKTLIKLLDSEKENERLRAAIQRHKDLVIMDSSVEMSQHDKKLWEAIK